MTADVAGRPVVRADQVTLGVLVSEVPRDAVDDAVAVCGVREQRSDGKLPAHVTAYLTLGLVLFPDDDYTEVAAKVTGSLDRFGCWNAGWSVPTSSAITQARKRLGRKLFAELFENTCGPVAGRASPTAAMSALGECGTHAFVAAQIGSYDTGEKTLAQRLYPRLRADELLTADRGFYSWTAWDTAQATGAALLWRAPTQLDLPVVRVLPDGTYHTVLIKPTIRGTRRERLLAAARAGADLDDITTVPDAFDQRGLPVAHLARVVEYDVPDRTGNGTGELIVLLTTILHPAEARADELAAAYHQRWEQETGNDQLKTHLRGPGRVLRSRLPGLVHQESWSYLLVHHAISALTAKASAAADLDPDRISFNQDPAPDPPHRPRDGGHSPLRTGLIDSHTCWPRSRHC